VAKDVLYPSRYIIFPAISLIMDSSTMTIAAPLPVSSIVSSVFLFLLRDGCAPKLKQQIGRKRWKKTIVRRSNPQRVRLQNHVWPFFPFLIPSIDL
jgi:hypothetical protein